MNPSSRPNIASQLSGFKEAVFRRHLISISQLDPVKILALFERAETYLSALRRGEKKFSTLKGRTQVNLFFENSTRTLSSFELAGKRLGADVVNMAVARSSVSKGETLLDTAATLNAMAPDILVVRHDQAGAANLLAQKVDCSLVNAGDGCHEHPTQALLDALTLRVHCRELSGLTIAICGDILHSRVARSNLMLLTMLGANVRFIGPKNLIPANAKAWKVEIFHSMEEGLKGVDVVMMLRLQKERMRAGFIPSTREYFQLYGLDRSKLGHANKGALVMHPGPMNRGLEIDSEVADDVSCSLITHQVEMGVVLRMAVLEYLAGLEEAR